MTGAMVQAVRQGVEEVVVMMMEIVIEGIDPISCRSQVNAMRFLTPGCVFMMGMGPWGSLKHCQ
jgi:hypothetical protein